jgi:hypothetical protein
MTLAQTAQVEFKRQVEAFLALSGMSHSRFGLDACGDKSFVTDMRKGNREFRPATIVKIETFMNTWLAATNANIEPDRLSASL